MVVHRYRDSVEPSNGKTSRRITDKLKVRVSLLEFIQFPLSVPTFVGGGTPPPPRFRKYRSAHWFPTGHYWKSAKSEAT